MSAPVDFDGRALYAAMDEKRLAEGLSWQGVAEAIWELSAELHAARIAAEKPDHPIAVATIKNLDRRGNTSCQHALFFLRWLGRTPESFLVAAGAGAPLPDCGRAHRPRWNLRALHAALDDERGRRGLTWAAAAAELGCTPGQLTGLRTAKFAIGMRLAMRITHWLQRPAADFVYCARW